MLYGFCPYEESSITKLINLIDNSILKFPPEIQISGQVKILLKRMMTIRYRERISPSEFIKYQLEVKEQVSSELVSLKEAVIFSRKNIAYLA